MAWVKSGSAGFRVATARSRVIPLGAALEMLYTGGSIDVQEAYRVGLVNHVVAADELMSKCEQIAAEIVKSAPLAVQKMKSVVMQGLDMPLSEAVKLEHEYFEWLMQTEDAKEDTRAFAEKRAPNWKAK
jgi:enoyl-CoA hydratase/carnithine racemase